LVGPAKPQSATCDDRVMPELYGREHVDRYRATDGEDGHYWREALVLLLTTTGRKSGEKRTTPLLYGRRGDDVVLIASNGGAPAHPPWYLNLRADPEVEVRIKGERYKARARDASPAERRSFGGRWPDTTRPTTSTSGGPRGKFRSSSSSALTSGISQAASESSDARP
jgi:deazaflavin-dependent oxidoreductase (nitroreductase family)